MNENNIVIVCLMMLTFLCVLLFPHIPNEEERKNIERWKNDE